MLLAFGVLLEEQHQPGPDDEGCAGGDEHPEEAVVLEDGLQPQLALVQEEAHLLDPDEVPALERRHQHSRRLRPAPLEIAATVGGDYQAHEVLRQHDGPERKESADKGYGGRSADVAREDDDGDDQPGDSQQGHRELRDLFDLIYEVVAPTRRLDPGDGLAPSLRLASLSFQALLLQALQALDALDGGRLFLQRGAVRSSSHFGGVLHAETKIVGGRRSLRFLVSSLLAEVRFRLT